MADSIEKKLASLRAEIESVSTEAMGYRTCDPNRAYAVKENMLCILDSISRALSPAGGDEIKLDVLRIPRSKSLDPITVYFEDHAPGVGRVTIACYGDAWTAAWSAMGERTVRQFIADVDAGYLSGAMLQLCGGNDRHRSYTDRVAAAVIAALAASPQQEPGAPHWGNLPDGFDDPELYPPTPAVESGASGQTLAGAGGEVAAFERWARGRFSGAEVFDRIESRPANEIGLTWEYNGYAVQSVWAAWIGRATLTATSAGTTGDDSEDAARLPSAQGWLDSHCSVASPDWMRGWDAAREALDAARRAREVGND